MENEHELSYETLTKVYLGSYEHYKSVVAEVEHSKHGFELQGAKMVEMGSFRSTFPTKGMRSIISTVSISLEDFLSSILLRMVIIVAVVIVTVIWVVIFVNVIVGVVIVVAIIGVVVFVTIIGIVVVVGGVPSIIKLSFVIIGFLHRITLYYLVH
ncbi:hypothetical protein Tco_1238260 [Tanacetum coccineum]